MQTTVVIATSGRARVVADLIGRLASQTRPPLEVIVSCVYDEDVVRNETATAVRFVKGSRGLTAQRNRGLAAVSPEARYIAFFDDDFIPAPGWLEAAERYFDGNPDVVCLTGALLADGINGPGLKLEDAEKLLQSDRATAPASDATGVSPYGCNMAFRKAAIENESFDERLVLYGWQEDRDFGARVGRRGRMVRLSSAKGVHLGVKSGRVSGVRLGYSQVINPLYLYRKGTMAMPTVLSHVLSNVAANLVKSIRPEPYVDRIGRLRGNAIAMRDVICGDLRPERAEAL